MLPLRIAATCTMISIGLLLGGCSPMVRTSLASLEPDDRASQVVVLLPAAGVEIDRPRPFFDDDSTSDAFDDDEEDDEGGRDLVDWIVDGAIARVGKEARDESIAALHRSYPAAAFERLLRDQLAARPMPRLLQPGASIRIVRDPGDFVLALADRTHASTLGLAMRYAVSADRVGLYLQSDVSFMARPADGPREAASARYVSEFVNHSAYRSRGRHRRVDVDHWSGQDAQHTRTAMATAVGELLDLLETDFVDPAPLASRNRRFTTFSDSEDADQTGAILAEAAERILVATTDRLHWLDAVQINNPNSRR